MNIGSITNRKRMCVLVLLALVVALNIQTAAARPAGIGGSQKYGITILKTDDKNHAPRELPRGMAKRQLEVLDLARANPEDFNFPWVDWKTGEIVIDVSSDKGAQLAEAVNNQFDIKQRIRRIKNSWADLHRISEQIVEAQESGMFPELNTIWEIDIDWENNRLIALADQISDELLRALASRFDRDSIAVCQAPEQRFFALSEKPSALDHFLGSRFGEPVLNPVGQQVTESAAGTQFIGPSDYTRWTVFGGSLLTTGNGKCTNGFSWHYGGDIYGMITAGRCIPYGGNAYAPLLDANGENVFGSVWGGHWENWDPGVGTVRFLPPNEGGQVGDLASIQMNQYSLNNAVIFRDNIHTYPVKEMGTNSLYNSLYTFGIGSGELSGWVVQQLWVPWVKTYSWAFDDNERIIERFDGYLRGAHKATKGTAGCIQSIDSGGPVYWVRPDLGIMAKGIISSAHTDQAGPCVMMYTDIQTVKWTFGGSLHTQ